MDSLSLPVALSKDLWDAEGGGGSSGFLWQDLMDSSGLSKLCDDSDLCHPESKDLTSESSVPFVACVTDAYHDPSPCAWEALLAGRIPVILSSTWDDAYELFPVLFVDDWSELFQTDTEGNHISPLLVSLSVCFFKKCFVLV